VKKESILKCTEIKEVAKLNTPSLDVKTLKSEL
jgi:hypothetical protein